MNKFKQYVLDNHPDPDTLGNQDTFDQMCLLAENYAKGNTPCPCNYLDEPCKPNCTCVNLMSSAGCDYCATYGSKEQRKLAAEQLAEKYKSKNDWNDDKVMDFVNWYIALHELDSIYEFDNLTLFDSFNEFQKNK